MATRSPALAATAIHRHPRALIEAAERGNTLEWHLASAAGLEPTSTRVALP